MVLFLLLKRGESYETRKIRESSRACDGVLPDMGKHGGSVDAGTGCNTGQ